MQTQREIKFTKCGVELDGKYEVLLCGSLFYFRLPKVVWKDRITKLKRAGYNCVDVYFPWNYHERADGSFDFSGERDVRYFLEELKQAGLYVIARPGPYICSEWNGGALPARLLESGNPIRCDDAVFLAETAKWYQAILNELAPFTYPNGGSVIMLQLENELDFFDCPDPEAYIAKLEKLARATIKDIPLICCAGQYNVARAGGFTKGVNATLNCYPDSLDASFDKELQAYAFRFEELGKPLFVSETNRDHFLLRRELSCGSKLLGAYNQVAGVNLEYFQAVNNWGSPDAFLATLYDFWSMIDVAGNYREEVYEAILFSAFLKTAGGALAGALPERESVLPSSCSFKTTEDGLRVLTLEGGGAAVCVPNFSQDGSIQFTCRGREVKAEVKRQNAPFFLFDFDLSPSGIPARITRATAEPIRANANEIAFYSETAGAVVGLDFGEGEELFTADGTTHGVAVRILNREQAIALLTENDSVVCGSYTPKPLNEYFRAELPVMRELPVSGQTNFGALQIGEGAAEYTVKIPQGKELFLEHPCDMLKVEAIGLNGDTHFADGRDVVLPASADGVYKVTAEKWGHSNFDDSGSPALRVSCKKGVTSFGVVVHKQVVQRCDFELLDEYGAKKLALKNGFPVRLSVDKWNSTRKPVVCSYTITVKRECERLIAKTTENTDVAVYLDGALLGECEYGSFELTSYMKKDETHKVTFVYRKRVWTQNVGNLTLLHIDRITPTKIRALTAKETAAISGKGESVSLPVKVEGRTVLYVPVETDKESLIAFYGKNVKLTCVVQGRVVGRLLVDWEGAPSLQGGEPHELYWCPAWGKELYLYVEALGEDAYLTKAELLSV